MNSSSTGPGDALRRVLRLKLYAFFAASALTVAAVVFMALLLTGGVSLRDRRGRLAFDNELNRLAAGTERRLGELSAMTLQLSRMISRGAEQFLSAKDLSPDGLMRRPELLEPLLASQFDLLMLSLQRSRATGAFMILNATASLRLQEAVTSRSGLYLVNWAPDFVNGSALQYQLLRGPAGIALDRGFAMEKEWGMEFDVQGADYFSLPQSRAEETPEEAEHVCLWFPAASVRGTARRAMLCAAPLVDSQGNAFGVCGFDLTDLYFKRTNVPASNIYEGAFCALVPIDETGLDLSGGLVSWRYFVDEGPGGAGVGKILRTASREGLTVYQAEDGSGLVGAHRILRVQPTNLPEGARDFAFALLVPKESYDAASRARALRLALPFAIAAGVGVLLSLCLSRLYLRPVLSGWASDGLMTANPQELDELAELLNAHPDDARRTAGVMGAEERTFNERAATLSPAERAVFDLCLQGCSAGDVASALNISPNTVKTHNRNIFAKMGVSSQRELLTLYIGILKARRRTGPPTPTA